MTTPTFGDILVALQEQQRAAREAGYDDYEDDTPQPPRWGLALLVSLLLWFVIAPLARFVWVYGI